MFPIDVNNQRSEKELKNPKNLLTKEKRLVYFHNFQSAHKQTMNSSRILSSLGKKYGVPSLFGFAGWLTFSDNAKQMNFANVQSLSFFQPNTADAEPLEKRLTLRKKLTDMSLQEKWDYFTLVSINPGEDDVSGTKKETGIFVLILP